jgi:hypothetical protein
MGLGFRRKVESQTRGVNHLLHHHPPSLPLMDEMIGLLVVPDLSVLQMTTLLALVLSMYSRVMENLTRDRVQTLPFLQFLGMVSPLFVLLELLLQ